VDGDGYDDLVIGADEDNDNGWDSGSAYVYYGDCPDEDEDGYCATSDCDDEDSSVGRASTWHADTDSDGYGDPSRTTTACAPPSGYTSVDHDCDDTDAAIHPGATEGVGDEVDSDCDGTETCYADKDDDGYTDTTATVDSVDTDCADSGEGSSSDPDQDCDDRDSSFHPGAAEDDCTDPNDYNCDGSVAFADADADGWAACEECDDSDAGVNPDAEEILDDGIDQDCDGVDEVTPAGGDDGGSDDGGSDDGGSDATGKEACGCSSNPAPGRGAGMLIGLLALVGLRRRKPRAVDEGGEASVA
jgi:MYXO-CTERM domain-containing protein